MGLHKAVAEEYNEVLKENLDFSDFLLALLPNFDMTRCFNCGLNGSSCNGIFFEYHLNPDNFIFDLERIRQGFCEDFSYRSSRANRISSSDYESYSGKSIDITKSIPVKLELLTGNIRMDRYLLKSLENGESHLRDYFSIDDEFHEGLRTDLDS